LGTGECFKTNPLRCTLLARWDTGYQNPWLMVTDLLPVHANACWYGLRSWIEQGFKATKRGGWPWQPTHRTDPARATRLWLALAVATLWVLAVGGEAEATQPLRGLEQVRRPTSRAAPAVPRPRACPPAQLCSARRPDHSNRFTLPAAPPARSLSA
jgi:hypothetical protein